MTAPPAHPARTPFDDAVTPAWRMGSGTRSATEACAAALFARAPVGAAAPTPPDAGRVQWMLDDLEHFLALSGRRARLLYGLALFAVTWLAPLHLRRLGPLRRLALPDRLAALEAMERGALSLAVLAVKTIQCMIWFEHPAALAEMGHDGACLEAAESAEAQG